MIIIFKERVCQKLIACYLALSAILIAFSLTSCNDSDEPKITEDPQLKEDASDIVGGKLFHCIDVNNLNEGRIPVEVLNDIAVSMDDNSVLDFSVTTESDGSKYIVPELKTTLAAGESRFVKLKVAMKNNPDVVRNLLVILHNGEEDETRAGIETDYSAYLGKGTQYFGEIGNTTRAVFLYNNIDKNDEEAINAITTINDQDMLEIEGDSYEETINTFHLNVGVSTKVAKKASEAKRVSFAGEDLFDIPAKQNRVVTTNVNIGIDGKIASSRSYEYYLNYIKVIKAWVEINAEHFIGDEYTRPSSDLPNVISKDLMQAFFSNDITASEGAADKFFDTWGTDVITSGLFGGYAIYLYGRSENCYSTTVGFDANVSTRSQNAGSTDGVTKDWAKIYKQMNGGNYKQVEAGLDYQNDNYEKASKAVSYSKYVGGSNALDADSWLDGFSDSKNWALISYSKQAIDKDEETMLTPLEFVLEGLIDYYVYNVADECDEDAINEMYERIVKLSDYRINYIEKHGFEMDPDKKRLVLADLMMLKMDNGHKKGQPQPFIGENPRYSYGDEAQYLIYYPMMANKNAPCDNGYAIETSQDDYAVFSDTSDHYWYYALASEDEVTGIYDIKFEKKEGDGYHFRGDNPDQGWVDITKNYVCVRYYLDSPECNTKITAFGLYHKDSKEGAFDANRVIASTAGAELGLNATTTEIDKWNSFWNTNGKYVLTQWYEGTVARNYNFWPCYTTATLEIDRMSDKNVVHPKAWGE